MSGQIDTATLSLVAPSAPPEGGAAPGERARSPWGRVRRTTLGVVGVCVTVIALELVSVLHIVSAHEIPPAFDVLRTLGRLLVEGGFWSLTAHTLVQAGVGLLIATVIAVPLGLLVGASDPLWHAVRPTVEFLRPVPAVAIIPLVILLYGTGEQSAIVLVAFGTLFPLLVQAIYGRREVDAMALETARSFRLGRVRRLRQVILPSALPYLATGMRLTASGALMLAVTTELVVGSAGLGAAVAGAQNAGDFERMYALILAASLLGLVVNLLLERGEARVLAWHPSQRRDPA